MVLVYESLDGFTFSNLKQKFSTLDSDPNSCWAWNGHMLKSGPVCQLVTSGENEAVRVKNANPRRIIAKMFGVNFLSKKTARVTCGNPMCVNPSHLEVSPRATRKPGLGKSGNFKLNADQVRDVIARLVTGESVSSLAAAFHVSQPTIRAILGGRTWREIERPAELNPKSGHARGEKHYRAKLTTADVLHIRDLAGQKIRAREICEKFGVSQSTIANIIKRRMWKDVPPSPTSYADR